MRAPLASAAMFPPRGVWSRLQLASRLMQFNVLINVNQLDLILVMKLVRFVVLINITCRCVQIGISQEPLGVGGNSLLTHAL